MARPHRPAADKDTGRTPHRDLPGDLYGRHVQELRRPCRAARGGDRLPAHGRWRMVEQAAAARDIPVGHSWAFREQRTMAKLIADEKSETA
jgi:hypothetical protein